MRKNEVAEKKTAACGRKQDLDSNIWTTLEIHFIYADNESRRDVFLTTDPTESRTA